MKYDGYKDILTLLKGSTFLASGGGGPYYLAKKLVKHYHTLCYDLALNTENVDNVNLNSWTCVAAGMGEPSSVGSLKPEEFIIPTIYAVDKMEQLLSKEEDLKYKNENNNFNFDMIVPVEVGAMNVAISYLTAVEKGVSLVDGDPSGRSVPTINLTTFATTQNVMPNMAASSEYNDNSENPVNQSVVLALENYTNLGLAYSNLIDAGLLGKNTGLCLSPMQGKDIQDGSLVKGTLTDATVIGNILEESNTSLEKISQIKEYLENKAQTKRKVQHICTGTVIEYFTQSINDNDIGYIKIQTTDNRIFTIVIQNENIIGQYNNDTGVYITGPDSICYLSTKNGSLTEDNDIIDNVVIETAFENGKNLELHVLGIEATSTVLNNAKLMNEWELAYQVNNYYGPYQNNLWEN